MARRDKPPRRRPDQPPPSERAKRPAESDTQAKASISFEYYETGSAYVSASTTPIKSGRFLTVSARSASGHGSN